MRYPKILLATLAGVALAGGCVAGCASAGGSSAAQSSVAGYLSAAGGQQGGSGPAGNGRHGGYSPVRNGPAPGVTAAGARSAAAKFDSMYFGGQFSQAWDLLTPAARQEIPRGTWVAVHQACPGVSSSARAQRPAVKSVTVFGTAAIVTESTGTRGATVEYVLNYSGGTWSFAPGNVSIYHHGSDAASVTAAKKAGLCAASPEVF